MVNYEVTIVYREPEFQDHASHKAPYEVVFKVDARDEDHAKKLAIEQFKNNYRNEWVHWTQEILENGIRVRPVPEGEA